MTNENKRTAGLEKRALRYSPLLTVLRLRHSHPELLTAWQSLYIMAFPSNLSVLLHLMGAVRRRLMVYFP